MIIASLVFGEPGICRGDPNIILNYPLRQLLFWFDLCIGWRKEVTKATELQQSRQQQARSFSK